MTFHIAMNMANESSQSDGYGTVPIEAIQHVDPSVRNSMPPGIRVESIDPHGASHWTRTASISIENDEGLKSRCFLKVCRGDNAADMVHAEFEAMRLISAIIPGFVPVPIACGTYQDIPDTYFFLGDFHDLTGGLPDIDTFPARLAELHRRGSSASGMFGFHRTTYHGRTPLEHGWYATWEEYFHHRLMYLLALEKDAQGPSKEIEALEQRFLDQVVPRLLRPMETEGRSIKPSLLHGDLWHGNATMDRQTQKPIIYDAACFYGHNEYDMGVWRQDWNELGKPYMDRYLQYFPASEPVADFEDRNLLYATSVDALDSILYKTEDYRASLIKGMTQLVEKHAST